MHARALEWAELLRDRSRLAEADSDSLKATIGEAKEAVSGAHAELQRARDAVSDVRVEMGRIEVQVENAIAAITSQDYVLDEALQLPEPEDRAAMEAEAASLRRQIAGIGPVNEVAMDEYLRLKERADYIGEQVDDLERARGALAKITSPSSARCAGSSSSSSGGRELPRFLDALPGGQARLEMTDPDHLAETGMGSSHSREQAHQNDAHERWREVADGTGAAVSARHRFPSTCLTRSRLRSTTRSLEAARRHRAAQETTQLIVIATSAAHGAGDVLYGVSMRADGVSHVVSQRLDQVTGRWLSPDGPD